MKFYMPTRIYEESDCVRKHAREMASLGTKALIITGRSSAVKCGALDDVTAALSECGRTWIIFNKTEENPSTQTVMAAAELGKTEGCDFVIGIGGGSPMDAAKGAALLMKHPSWGIEMLYTKGQDNSSVPMVMIPTTCGTGSEATPVSVLTNHSTQRKGSIPYKLFPDYGLVDGKYLKNVPAPVLNSTAVDALAHLWESYFSALRDEYSLMLVREGLKEWAKNKDVLLEKHPASDAELASLMHASTLAGMAIAHTGTSLPHGLSYTLTYDLHVPHGAACGFYLKGFLDHAPSDERQEALSLAGFASTDEWQDFFIMLCGDMAIPMEVLEKAADVAVDTNKLTTASYAVDLLMLQEIAGVV